MHRKGLLKGFVAILCGHPFGLNAQSSKGSAARVGRGSQGPHNGLILGHVLQIDTTVANNGADVPKIRIRFDSKGAIRHHEARRGIAHGFLLLDNPQLRIS